MNHIGWLILLLILQWIIEVVCSYQQGWRARPFFSGVQQGKHAITSPAVSILVPAWNDSRVLGDCLDSLLSVQYPTWEVVVIAGGDDGTYERALEFCDQHDKFRAVRQEPLGKNHALNQGLALARGEIIVILDADSTVGENWLGYLVAPFAGEAGAATGKGLPRRRTPVSSNELMQRLSANEIHHQVTLQGSASIAIRRAVLEQVGGFPEDVFVGVDWDLDARCQAKGVRRVYCPQAVITTERPATWGEFWANEVRWRRAHLSSILRLPETFLSSPMPAVASLYVYLLAWAFLIFGMLSLIGLLLGLYLPAILWLILLTWTLLRGIKLPVKVAAYTREGSWLSYTWVAPLLLLLTLAAIIPATLTLNRQTRQFKGARPKPVNGK